MRRHPAALALLPLLACVSCSSPGAARADEPLRQPAGDAALEPPARGGARAPESAAPGLAGLFVPAAPAEMSLWPEAYRGEFLVLQVAPQGARVEAGQVLVELDAREVEREIAGAEFELRAAQTAHEALVAKKALAEEQEHAALERARAALERARRDLEGWQQHELVLAARGDELARARERSRVEDQEDELEQLQLMYSADELTDATEDLVLKRTRRDLELTREVNGLNEDLRAFQNDFQRAKTSAEREEALGKQTLELAHLERTQALEVQSREVALQRSARELEKQRGRLAELQRDRELFTLRAPQAGLFLHGDPDDYRPASVPAPLQRGSKLSAHGVVGHVAPPYPEAVALDLDATTAAGLSDGAAATVQATGRTGARPLAGRVRLSAYPTPGKAGLVYRARVELDAPAEDLRVGMPAAVTLTPLGKP